MPGQEGCAVNLNQVEFAALSGELLEEGHAVRFRAGGSSMWPFIRDGDVLIVEPLEGGAVRVGDVVLYRTAAGRVMAHRVVIRTTDDGDVALLIRGDGSEGAGDTVVPGDVLGRVTWMERGGGAIRLDRWPRRMLVRLWIGLWPLSLRCWHALSAARRAVLSLLNPDRRPQ